LIVVVVGLAADIAVRESVAWPSGNGRCTLRYWRNEFCFATPVSDTPNLNGRI
jgi:hypothetical protein